MKRISLILSMAMLTASFAAAQPAKPPERDTDQPRKEGGREFRGTIVRAGQDQVVIRTGENKEVTVRIRPQTRFLRGDRAIRFADLKVGANINAAYLQEGEFYFADAVTVVNAATEAIILEGQVVKIVGKEQIVLRTPDGQETTVYVDAKTAFEVSDRVTRIEELKPGANVAIDYDEKDGRRIARRIVNVRLMEGEVVRVVGKDQVILRGPDRKEFIVYVAPETRYLLGAQAGGFVDLRPGVSVGVYYDVRDDRHFARHFFQPRRGR